MSEQLIFDLPRRTSLGREDYFVSPGNVDVIHQLDHWQDWPNGKLILSGAAGAGKTHLAHIWAADCGGQVVNATSLAASDLAGLAIGPVCIDNLNEIAGDRSAEEAAFHLHNLLLQASLPLLITGVGSWNHWGITLPDLASRLGQSGMVTLRNPDDMVLAVVLAKQFSDKQMVVSQPTISYILRHCGRSFADIHTLVNALDHASLQRKKPITRALVSEVMDS